MTREAIITVLVSSGLATIVVAVINAVATRRKLGSEATKIITDAAGGFVSTIQLDNARLREQAARDAERIAALERRVDEFEDFERHLADRERKWDRQRRELDRALQSHAAWDRAAIAKLKSLDPPIYLPTPPPLLPPDARP